MAESFRCVVATPTRLLFSGDVYYADVPGYMGHYGVLRNHENLVATNHQGGRLTLWLDPDGSEKKIFLLHRGCTQMLHNHLSVLARFGHEVDGLNLEYAKERAEEVRAAIEAKKVEMESAESEQHRKADEAFITTEEIHLSWFEAVINYLETGQESYKQ